MFDVVISHGPSDDNIIHTCIQHVLKNVRGSRKVYVVSHRVPDWADTIDTRVSFFHESVFPFQKQDIVRELEANNRQKYVYRTGWYLQQLIKLYAGTVLPDILPRYLVVDADCIWIKPTTFENERGDIAFNVSNEHHAPYFEHMKHLHPSFIRQRTESGISHSLMFRTDWIAEIMELVGSHHGNEVPFWKLFMRFVADHESGASEYEIYFHYCVKHHPNEIYIRPLQFANESRRKMERMIRQTVQPYDYICFHHWIG